MPLKIKKHIILAFLVLLMFIIIPISFASDVNDDGCMEMSVDDSKSMDNVVSISEESETVLNMENDFANSQNGTLLGADGYSGIIYVSKSGNENKPYNSTSMVCSTTG